MRGKTGREEIIKCEEIKGGKEKQDGRWRRKGERRQDGKTRGRKVMREDTRWKEGEGEPEETG